MTLYCTKNRIHLNQDRKKEHHFVTRYCDWVGLQFLEYMGFSTNDSVGDQWVRNFYVIFFSLKAVFIIDLLALSKRKSTQCDDILEEI